MGEIPVGEISGNLCVFHLAFFSRMSDAGVESGESCRGWGNSGSPKNVEKIGCPESFWRAWNSVTLGVLPNARWVFSHVFHPEIWGRFPNLANIFKGLETTNKFCFHPEIWGK